MVHRACTGACGEEEIGLRVKEQWSDYLEKCHHGEEALPPWSLCGFCLKCDDEEVEFEWARCPKSSCDSEVPLSVKGRLVVEGRLGSGEK